ncbi:MAG: hypothetical protein ACRDBH_10695 [Bosea sp. (in: a-proteobacteria)]
MTIPWITIVLAIIAGASATIMLGNSIRTNRFGDTGEWILRGWLCAIIVTAAILLLCSAQA